MSIIKRLVAGVSAVTLGAGLLGATPAIAGGSVEWVNQDSQVADNETPYTGWHSDRLTRNPDGTDIDVATKGSYEFVSSDGKVTGLRIRSGSSQGLSIIKGFDPSDLVAGGVGTAAANMKLTLTENSSGTENPSENRIAIPVLYYPKGREFYADGQNSPKFTTIQAHIPIVPAGEVSDMSTNTNAWHTTNHIVDANDATLQPKNTSGPVSLDTIVNALGDHDVIGYGIFVRQGGTQSMTVKSITFNGLTTNFFTDPTPDPTPAPTPDPTPTPTPHKKENPLNPTPPKTAKEFEKKVVAAIKALVDELKSENKGTKLMRATSKPTARTVQLRLPALPAALKEKLRVSRLTTTFKVKVGRLSATYTVRVPANGKLKVNRKALVNKLKRLEFARGEYAPRLPKTIRVGADVKAHSKLKSVKNPVKVGSIKPFKLRTR